MNHDIDKQNGLRDEEKNSIMPFYKVLQRYIPIVIVNLLFIGIMGYFISPLSKVGAITIVGTQHVYDQTVLEESAIKNGDSVIQTAQNMEEVGKKITENIPQISETSIAISGFNEVVINVEEFGTVAYIAQEGSYLRVLENGKVLDDVYAVSLGNQPVLSNFTEGQALDLMIEELSLLEEPILNLISEIELVEHRTNPLFIQVYMNNGNRVLSSIPSFSEKIPYYPQLVAAVSGQKGIFDMEVGVYFIPFMDGEEINENTEVDESERQPVEGFNE